MPDKSLINYIKQQLNQGFDIYTIRSHLVKYGYSAKDIDDAINHLYKNKKHTIHLSKPSALALIFLFIGVSIAISSVFIFMSPSEKKEHLLDLETNPITPSIEQGEYIEFSIELFNIGYKEKFDAHLIHKVKDSNNREITSSEEEMGLTTRASKTTKVLIPSETESGNYKVETTALYDGKTASASFTFTINPTQETETCTDNIKNQGEEDIDCGGPCKECEDDEEPSECTDNCNDNNICTEDICDNNQCIHDPITPCCGNNICEETEECEIDCSETETEKSLTERINDIIKIAETKPENAENLCAGFNIPIEKDQCYKEVALATDDNDLCAKIENIIKKDSCIMNVAINTNNYENCNSISNPNLKTSCELLADR